MSHAVGALFPIPTLISGNIYTLSASASAAASNTKATLPALTGGQTYRFIGETTVTVANSVPTAPATFSNEGWRLAPLASTLDPATLLAGSLTFQFLVNSSQSVGTPGTIDGTMYAILFAGTTEIGRGQVTYPQNAGDTTLTTTISWSDTAVAANAPLNLEVYYLAPATNLNFGATTIILKYTTAGTKIGAGLTYTVQAARAVSESKTTTDTPTRAYTGVRGISDSSSLTEAPTRAVVAQRSVAETSSTSETPARAFVGARAISESATTVDAPTRAYTGARAIAESSTTSEAPTRQVASSRAIAESSSTSDTVTRVAAHPRAISETSSTSDTPTRQYTGTRGVTESSSTSEVVSRLIIYGRFVVENLATGGTTIIKKIFMFEG